LFSEADLDRRSARGVVAIPIGDVVEIRALGLLLPAIAAQIHGILADPRIVSAAGGEGCSKQNQGQVSEHRQGGIKGAPINRLGGGASRAQSKEQTIAAWETLCYRWRTFFPAEQPQHADLRLPV